MTQIRPFAEDDIRSLFALDVRRDQDGRVAPNTVTVAQSIFEPGSEIFGLWDGDTAVGLLAIVDMSHPDADLDEGDDPDGIYIWRLMVDAGAQGKGHGTAAIRHAIKLAQGRGRAQLVISSVPENENALHIYETLGFVRTGRMVDGEVELIRRPA